MVSIVAVDEYGQCEWEYNPKYLPITSLTVLYSMYV